MGYGRGHRWNNTDINNNNNNNNNNDDNNNNNNDDNDKQFWVKFVGETD